METAGEFLRTEDSEMLAGQEFLGGFFMLMDKTTGLRSLPFQGGPREQPAELMDILYRLANAIRKSP